MVAAVVALILLLSALLDDITSPEASPDAAGAIAAPPATAAPATETPEPAPEPPGFGDGTYLVGSDVQPGTYRTTGGSGCNWQRLSDVSGDYDAVLAWEWPDGQAYVEILPTDVAFTTEDCGLWTPATAAGPDVSSGFGDGTYLVGSDVQPGTYRTTGGSGCNWQRLSDVSGDYDAVLAWEWPDGQAYVEILPTDRAFTTEDCGTWSRNG